jgi:hypothetical protein
MKKILLIALACCVTVISFAQKGKGSNSVIKSGDEITWLGMDFSQARVIGAATQWKDVGEITDNQMRDNYIPAWNDFFLNEQKKYDVAKYVDRSSVHYAMDVTAKMNNRKYSKSTFSDDPGEYEHLEEADISRLVKGYDFKGQSGVGLLFFIEGMSKGKEETCAWVTFVDMKSRTVLQTKRIYGRAGGFGFRNYWAKSFFNILKNINSEMR